MAGVSQADIHSDIMKLLEQAYKAGAQASAPQASTPAQPQLPSWLLSVAPPVAAPVAPAAVPAVAATPPVPTPTHDGNKWSARRSFLQNAYKELAGVPTQFHSALIMPEFEERFGTKAAKRLAPLITSDAPKTPTTETPSQPQTSTPAPPVQTQPDQQATKRQRTSALSKDDIAAKLTQLTATPASNDNTD